MSLFHQYEIQLYHLRPKTIHLEKSLGYLLKPYYFFYGLSIHQGLNLYNPDLDAQ